MNDSSLKRNTIIAIGLIALAKAYIAATLQLHPDEAYYWAWSRHLDLGYFDHAPMIAYVIRLTTIFSQQELWVRMGGIIGTALASVLAWKLAFSLFRDKRVAAASAITLNVLPLMFAGSIIITPDVPAFFFTALSFYWCWRIVETKSSRYWYLLGVAFGLALLSKYTSVLIAPSVFLFVLFTDERRWLKTIHPYAGFALGCAFFLPVVYWNSQHNWISFAYQMRHGLTGYKPVHVNMLDYIGGQALAASPLIFLPGLYASIVYLFHRNKQKLFLSLTSLPVLVFFAYSSIQRAAQANWTVHAYFSFSILVAHYLLTGGTFKKRLWRVAVAFSAVLIVIVMLHARFSIIPLAKFSPELAEADATNWFYGWKELAEEIEKDPSVKFAMTEKNQSNAEISYYTRERVFVCVDYKRTQSNQYNFWPFPDGLRDANGVDVYLSRDPAPPYEEYFKTAGSTTTFTAYRNGFPIRSFTIVHGSGYKYPAAQF
jgi:4-amino-4-deoxy-L-arabinose transferase-like glycosyltransferase